MNNSKFDRWKSSTNCVFWGIIILSVFGWIGGLLGYFTGIADLAYSFASFLSEYGDGLIPLSDAVSGFYGVFYSMQFITLIGWGLYLYGLYDFKKIQPSDHTRRLVAKINTACWLGVTAILISMVNGFMNWIFMVLFMISGWVLTLISYIKFQSAFAELKHCKEWNETAREGAGNLRLSANLNIWLIFWPVVCLGIGLIIGGSAWQQAKYVKEHALEYAYSGGFDSILQTIENYKILIIAVSILLVLSALVMSIMQFIFRLMGWRKIHNGFLAENAMQRQNVTSSNKQAISGFCHKCGNPLSEDASFCAKCGTQRIAAASETIRNNHDETISQTDTDTVCQQLETEIPSESGENLTYKESETSNDADQDGKRKKLLLWGGIGIGVLALMLILWFVVQAPSGNQEDTRYVYTMVSVVHNTPSEYAEETGQLNFGSPVTVIDDVNGGEWVKVKFSDGDGNSKEGYAAVKDLLDFRDFEILKQAGFKYGYVQTAIQAPEQRKAVLDYFKQNQGDSIKIVSPDFDGVCVLSASVDGTETLAFVAGKNYTDDVLVVYTIDEEGEAHLYCQNEMSKDAEGIKSISSNKGEIHVTLTPKPGNKSISMSLEQDESEMATMPKASDYFDEPEGNEYTYVYTGTINGKYAIEMTLTSDGGAYYTGEYFYTKNKTPIQLRGQLTDDYLHLVLEEYVGLNMTGKFEGTLTRNGYSGTWTNADGDKSMPFKVTRK